ncbi:MAG: MBL fold metallo-hydrolase, partial [Burkholderiales bacterium]
VVESNGKKLVLLGDLIHVAAVQFDDPSVTIAFDVDPKAALKSRSKMFKQVAKEGAMVGAAHIAFPGLGHLRKVRKGYLWVPANFTQMN